jgi:hypothetical protein
MLDSEVGYPSRMVVETVDGLGSGDPGGLV